MLLTLALSAAAAPWSLDPASPPARLGPAPLLGPGAVRLSIQGRAVEAQGAAVVVLRPGLPAPAELRAQGQSLGRSERTWRVPADPGEDALDVALRWKAHPSVQTASPDLVRHHRAHAFDDPELGAQWYLELLDFDVLSETSLGDPSVRVAVIDGPIDITHPDLAAGVVAPYDAVEDDDDPNPLPGEGCRDPESTDWCDHHGTSSAGVITARANNGVDLVGLCSACSLVPIKLISPTTSLSDDVRAFEHAIEQDAAVINNSWGFTTAVTVPDVLAAVIERAATEPRNGLGALVVFAAGNDDRVLRDDELNGLPDVVTVGATDRYGFATAYTNRGNSLDLTAPSATVSLAAGGGLNTTFGGTSAAAPVVSGVGAWALSVDPSLSSTELAALLVETADPSRDDGLHDEVFGWGHLDAGRLHDRLLGIEPEEEEEERRGCSTAPAGTGLFGLLLLGGLFRRRR